MDLNIFTSASVAGVPLVLVVIGLVEWVKGFKGADGQPLFSGNTILLISLGIGLLLGGGYMLTQTHPPQTNDWWPHFTYWFALLIYGLAMGLVASGLYDTTKSIMANRSRNG